MRCGEEIGEAIAPRREKTGNRQLNAPNTQDEESSLTQVSVARRVFSIPTLLSFGVAAGVILFLATRFDLDWGETWRGIRDINPWLYLLALAFYYVSFIFRGMRWKILASNAAESSSEAPRVPSTLHTSQLIVIGWFVNSVTWLRMGDAYRAYAFAEDSKSSFSWSLGTLLAERVMDMVIVAAIILTAAGILAITQGQAVSGYIIVMAFVMTVGIVTVALFMKAYGERAANFLPYRIKAAYRRFSQGTLDSFQRMPLAMLLGLLGWIMEMGRLYLVLTALGIEASLALIPIVAVGHAILSTVPTPGGIGAVEPGVTGLLLIELAAPDAAATTIVDRSITYLSIVLIGAILFLLRQTLNIRRSRKTGTQAGGHATSD